MLRAWYNLNTNRVKSPKSRTLLINQYKMKQTIPISKKDIDVSLKWLKGEMTLAESSRHFQVFNMSAYHRLVMCLRQAYKDGKLIIK